MYKLFKPVNYNVVCSAQQSKNIALTTGGDKYLNNCWCDDSLNYYTTFICTKHFSVCDFHYIEPGVN